MKFKLAAVALLASVSMMCSQSNGDLLSRMLGRGGCGGCEATSCCDTPAPSCGPGLSLSINLHIGLPGRLFGGGRFGRCGSGCGAVDTGCGCQTAPVVAPSPCNSGCGVVADDCGSGCRLFSGRLLSRILPSGCGCDTGMLAGGCNDCAPELVDTCGPSCGGGCGLLSGRLFSRFGNNDCGCDTGCSVPEPCAPAPVCGDPCDTCGGGLRLLDRLGNVGCRSCGRTPIRNVLGRLRSVGCCNDRIDNCGCEPAPVVEPCNTCGIEADPCGCGGGRIRGFLSRFRSSGNCGGCGEAIDSCGCQPAPVVATPAPVCGGCDQPADSCGCGLSMSGRFSVGSCNTGCRPSLLSRVRSLQIPRGTAGCNTDCGCNTVEAAPCTGCGTSQPMNYQAAPVQAQPATEVTPSPAAAPAAEGSVVVPSTDGAMRRPLVDPNAFVIKK
ncbi:MAG: hypothetical protein AAF939_17810 [Planctomycetota bacterium]